MTETAYNHISVQTFQLLEDLEAAGQSSSPRGLNTKEANLCTLQINPLFSVIDFKERKFNWKYFAGELAWYLKSNPSIDFISYFSSFWKSICSNGLANSNYGNLLFNIHPSQKDSDFDGSRITNKPYNNQLEWVFNSLVKDKNTRQAVAFFNAPYFQYEENKDFVCTMYVNFWIRKDYLEMKVQMRSNDIFFGLTFDAPWFSTLHQSMFLNLKKIYPDLKLGEYYHCADNIHFYERHFELASKILDTGINSNIKLELKNPIFEFNKVDDTYKFQLTSHSNKYVENISSMLLDINKYTDEDWKNSLNELFNIEL